MRTEVEGLMALTVWLFLTLPTNSREGKLLSGEGHSKVDIMLVQINTKQQKEYFLEWVMYVMS